MAHDTDRTAPGGSSRTRPAGLAVLLVSLALVLSGCGWLGGSNDAPVSEATPAPVEQSPAAVEVIGAAGADDVEVGEPVEAEELGSGIYYVSSLYPLSGADLTQPVLVRMALDRAVPSGTPLAVAARADDGAPWRFLEARLDQSRRYVEFIVSELGTFGVLAIDTGSVSAAVGRQVGDSLARDAERPDGVAAPVCDGAAAAREDGYSAKSWKRTTVAWCLDKLGDQRLLEVTNLRGVPVRVTAPDAPDRGLTGDLARARVPWTAWTAALGGGDAGTPGQGTDVVVPPGRTLTLGADLEPGGTLLVTAADDARSRSLQVLSGLARGLSVQTAAFGVVEPGSVPDASRLLTGWLDRPACAAALGGSARALLRGCLGDKALTQALGPVATLLRPALGDPAMRGALQDRLASLRARAGEVEQRIQVRREKPDFGALVGRFTGSDRSLVIDADGVATETFDSATGRVIALRYQLSEPDGPGRRATATLTSVQVFDRAGLRGAVPRAGQKGTIALYRGVLVPPFLQTTYCDADRAAKGRCTDPAPVTPEPAKPTAPSRGPKQGGR